MAAMCTIALESTTHRKNCPICGRHEATPYRRRKANMVVEGCVDGFHSDAMLHLNTDDAEWHWRSAAIRARAGLAEIAAAQ